MLAAGVKERGAIILMSTEFQFGKTKKFWRGMVVMIAQQWKCI
jgi:hypothetical protein